VDNRATSIPVDINLTGWFEQHTLDYGKYPGAIHPGLLLKPGYYDLPVHWRF